MKIEFDLLRNALDSIDQAIELVAWDDEPNEARRLKRAMLAVAHGVELLLKERLRRIHPAFIWENIDNFPKLSARTVTVDTAISRLDNIGGIVIQERDIKLVRSLRDTRNAIEHYTWSTSKEEAERVIGQALGFALHFAEQELGAAYFGYGAHKDDTLESLLRANEHFASAFNKRYGRIENCQIAQRMTCSYCRAIVFDPETKACKVCGHWNPTEEDGSDVPY